jgi:hypothetical protein
MAQHKIISQETLCYKLCNDVDNHKFPTEISMGVYSIIIQYSTPNRMQGYA